MDRLVPVVARPLVEQRIAELAHEIHVDWSSNFLALASRGNVIRRLPSTRMGIVSRLQADADFPVVEVGERLGDSVGMNVYVRVGGAATQSLLFRDKGSGIGCCLVRLGAGPVPSGLSSRASR